ncbi:hypothetical protein [Tessaracoccus sp.]
MSASGPHTWAHRILTAAVTLLLMVLAAATASADPAGGPTTISVTVDARDGSRVQASGALNDSAGKPLPGALVEGRINGGAVANATTDAAGLFALDFTLPEPLQTGENQLVVVFGGQGDLAPSEAAAAIPAGQKAPPPPADTRLGVNITLSLVPSRVTAGGLVSIEGTITDATGAPLEGAMITVLIDGTESSDSRVTSGPSGTFQTFAEIPLDKPPGPAILDVSFAGNDAFTAGVTRQDLTVEAALVAEESVAPVSPTPAPTPTATATASVDDSAGLATSGVLPSDTTEPIDVQRPLSWFYVALIVVGGAVMLVAAALMFRTMQNRRGEAASGAERTLDHLLRPEAGIEDPDDAVLSDVFGDDVADASDGHVEGPPPRRGLG